MGCNCKIVESIIAIVIIIFALWETAWSDWIIIIAAILLILHAMKCKNCTVPSASMSAPVSKAPTKSKVKSKGKKK